MPGQVASRRRIGRRVASHRSPTAGSASGRARRLTSCRHFYHRAGERSSRVPGDSPARALGAVGAHRLLLGMMAGMCKNPQVAIDDLAVAELLAGVAAAVSRRVAAVSDDVYEVILREDPDLHDDKPVLALLTSSVHSNVGTCLQIMQHQIDLSAVSAPTASLEYARRRAQRGTPLTALLRAYRLGHTCFSDWLLTQPAPPGGGPLLNTAPPLRMSRGGGGGR